MDPWNNAIGLPFDIRSRPSMRERLAVFAERCWYWLRKGDLSYYLKSAWKSRFNVVKVSTLPPTWVDRDTVMLHSCFQVLVDFVELERPDIINGKNDDLEQLLFLYHWWTFLRPSRRLRSGYEEDRAFEFEDNVMLEHLVSMRGHLWT